MLHDVSLSHNHYTIWFIQVLTFYYFCCCYAIYVASDDSGLSLIVLFNVELSYDSVLNKNDAKDDVVGLSMT
jgi:hypothetical protein